MTQMLPEFFVAALQRDDIHWNNQLSLAPRGKWDKEKLDIPLRFINSLERGAVP